MDKFKKGISITLNVLTLGVMWGIKAFKTYKMFAKAVDLNKDGKTSLDELKQTSKDILNGKAIVKIEYKK